MFFFFKNDIIADKKCEELNETIGTLEENSNNNDTINEAVNLSCEILLLCKGFSVNENNRIINENGKVIDSAYNYVVDNIVKDKTTDLSELVNYISEELQKDELNLSDKDHAKKYANRIATLGRIFANNYQNTVEPRSKKASSAFNRETYIEELEKSNDFDSWSGKKDIIPNLKKDFFVISYCRKDYKKVYKDIAYLYDRGIPFWFDSDNHSGESWYKKFIDKYDDPSCKGAIIYVSENYFSSKSAIRELKYMTQFVSKIWKFSKPVVIINLSNKIEYLDIYTKAEIKANWKQYFETGSDGLKYFATVFNDDLLGLMFDTPTHIEELFKDINERFNITSNETDEHPPKSNDIVFDKLFLEVGDYFVGSGSKVAKKDIKEKFFAYDREDILLNAMISQLVTLGIIDDKCSDTYYKVLINRHDWKHILCDNIERKKLDAIKNEGLNAYNDYILNYFKNDNYSDFLQLKSVISGKYGEGVIENVFYKDNQLFLHIVFKNGHEGDFDVETMFYGNDTIVEYDTISDYELVCHYGKILEDINVKITPEFVDGVLHGSYSLTMNVKDYYDRNFENLPKLREIVNDCEKVYYKELMRDIAAEQETESLMDEATHMANEAAQGDNWNDCFMWDREKEEWVEKDDNLGF